MKVLTQKYIRITFLVVLLTNLVALMAGLLSQLLFLDVKMLLMSLFKQFLESISTARKILKKHVNKNLIISEEKNYLFQQNNNCWVFKKLIFNNNEKVRDHCQATGKFTGTANWRCNIN